MEHATFEQAVEVVKALPAEDRGRLSEWLKAQEQLDLQPNGTQDLAERMARYKQTQKWLQENREKYVRQWVALDGGSLIAHGVDALKVHAAAKAAGIEIPFLEHIVEEKRLFTRDGKAWRSI